MRTPGPMDLANVRDLPDLVRRVDRWSRAVDEALRAQPSVETLTFTIDPADLPTYVPCETPDPVAVTRSKTLRVSDSALISDAGLSWRRSDDPAQPGVKVEALPGTSSGSTYTITLVVTGGQG